MLNRVVALGVTGAVSDATLDEIDAFFRGAGVRYGVSLAPGADASLEARLRVARIRGRLCLDEVPARRGAGSGSRRRAPGRGDVGRRGVREHGRRRVRPAAGRGGGLPRARRATGAGTSSSPTTATSRPALRRSSFAARPPGSAAPAARPEHRGKGAQTALLAARIERARTLGLAALTTETGERLPDRPSGSYRNILRAGFVEAYLRPNLVSPA